MQRAEFLPRVCTPGLQDVYICSRIGSCSASVSRFKPILQWYHLCCSRCYTGIVRRAACTKAIVFLQCSRVRCCVRGCYTGIVRCTAARRQLRVLRERVARIHTRWNHYGLCQSVLTWRHAADMALRIPNCGGILTRCCCGICQSLLICQSVLVCQSVLICQSVFIRQSVLAWRCAAQVARRIPRRWISETRHRTNAGRERLQVCSLLQLHLLLLPKLLAICEAGWRTETEHGSLRYHSLLLLLLPLLLVIYEAGWRTETGHRSLQLPLLLLPQLMAICKARWRAETGHLLLLLLLAFASCLCPRMHCVLPLLPLLLLLLAFAC